MNKTVIDTSLFVEEYSTFGEFMTAEESPILVTEEEIVYYDMSRDKYLEIFNHFEFEKTRYFNDQQPPNRNGTEKDVEKLENVFRNLGFNVQTHQDLYKSEIFDRVREFTKQDHKATSCVCFAFLTHGDKGGVLYAKDKPYHFRDITMMLESGDAGLVGKPKIFFVQACRGKLKDSGVTPSGRMTDDSEVSFSIPTHADFLILYSTVEDYVSYRNCDGSFMIQELCKVIQAFWESWDLLHMITVVHRRVAYYRETYAPSNLSIHQKKQMPETRFTLTKLLKF